MNTVAHNISGKRILYGGVFRTACLLFVISSSALILAHALRLCSSGYDVQIQTKQQLEDGCAHKFPLISVASVSIVGGRLRVDMVDACEERLMPPATRAWCNAVHDELAKLERSVDELCTEHCSVPSTHNFNLCKLLYRAQASASLLNLLFYLILGALGAFIVAYALWVVRKLEYEPLLMSTAAIGSGLVLSYSVNALEIAPVHHNLLPFLLPFENELFYTPFQNMIGIPTSTLVASVLTTFVMVWLVHTSLVNYHIK